MFQSSQFPLLPFLAALVATSVAAAMYRLTSINTFIDHRKNVLRSVFREVCEAFPDLILLVQNVGKTGDPKREAFILRSVHPVAGCLAEEIQRLRKRYGKLKRRLTTLLAIISISGLVLALSLKYISALQCAFLTVAVFVWLLILGSFLRLEKKKDLRFLCLEDLLDRLERDRGGIWRFSEGRRQKFYRDASEAVNSATGRREQP
jgi:TRAP-type uncharacterized transport system fused permease subunit